MQSDFKHDRKDRAKMCLYRIVRKKRSGLGDEAEWTNDACKCQASDD
jgi:hypothetical protein